MSDPKLMDVSVFCPHTYSSRRQSELKFRFANDRNHMVVFDNTMTSEDVCRIMLGLCKRMDRDANLSDKEKEIESLRRIIDDLNRKLMEPPK